MINRNVTRTLVDTTETTNKTLSITSESLAFAFTTAEKLYIGFQGPFAARYFHMKVANTNPATLTVKYWDGNSFELVEDMVDQTFGMTRSGFISWNNMSDWKPSEQTPLTDVELYWVEISTSANFSGTTEVQAIENFFSDDDLLRQFYPELVSDSRFKPIDASNTQSTNFLEQHRAAKDMVVLRLKQRKMIDFEHQIIDINAVAIAAVHAAAWIILNPIATSDDIKELATRARTAFDEEIAQVSFSIDRNEDGIVSDAERRSITATTVVRR
jgi:hypothetical protein